MGDSKIVAGMLVQPESGFRTCPGNCVTEAIHRPYPCIEMGFQSAVFPSQPCQQFGDYRIVVLGIHRLWLDWVGIEQGFQLAVVFQVQLFPNGLARLVEGVLGKVFLVGDLLNRFTAGYSSE